MNEEDDEYDVVNSDNYNSFQWKSKTNINICKCFHLISESNLIKCQKTLTKVWFQYPLLLENVKQILQHCPNLVDMSFEDALINEYKPALCPDSKIIEHNNLQILEITTSLEKISKNEYWILDFLTRGVSLNNLTIFTFWKNLKRLDNRPTLESNEAMELFGQLKDDNIVASFILKHRETIKNLWIGGNGFKLFNSDLNPLDLECLRKIQLDSLTCTFNGESLSHQILLEQQRNLKKFILFSRFNVPKANPDAAGGFMTRVINCLSRNSETLTEVTIYPKIVFENKDREELLEENFLENFTINCDIFSHCKSLKSLAIGLLCFENLDGNAEGWPTILGTRILNMHRIPSSLRELQIFVEDYNKNELQLLGRKFSTFEQLVKFSFSTSPLNPQNLFVVELDWIKTLSTLPKMADFSFFNFEFEDAEAVGHFVSHRSRRWAGGDTKLLNRHSQVEVAITIGQVVQTYGHVEGVTFRVSRFIA